MGGLPKADSPHSPVRIAYSVENVASPQMSTLFPSYSRRTTMHELFAAVPEVMLLTPPTSPSNFFNSAGRTVGALAQTMATSIFPHRILREVALSGCSENIFPP